MLNKFGNITKRVAPILDLISDETQNVKSSIGSGDLKSLGNTVERLGLLTSRLYAEYLSGQNAFAESPDLLNEALRVLTMSQEATVEAQNALNNQSSRNLGGAAEGEEVGEEEDEEEDKESFLTMAERRLTLFSALGIPAWMFYMSKDFHPIKKNITKGFALTGGLICLRYYMKQYGGQDA